MMVASMAFYPIFLNVSGKRAVVVGGGPVAVRKARGLLEAGAKVVLIAPELSADIPVEWRKRRYRLRHVAGWHPVDLRKNGFHIAISTDGRNPSAAADLRRQLEESLEFVRPTRKLRLRST